MRTVAIVQARMGSSRLPGKILADLAGAPMLEREIERVRRAKTLDDIMVATTTDAKDDPVVALSERLGVKSFRGSETDVLSRYLGAAAVARADVIVRITADCPLIDADVIDRVVRARSDVSADYASNVLARSYPRGLDTEVVTRAALERCAAEASSTAAREHVTWYIHSERPELFERISVENEVDASDLRWTVDTPEDLAMMRAVYEGLALREQQKSFPEILAWVRSHPEISGINAAIEQKKIEQDDTRRPA